MRPGSATRRCSPTRVAPRPNARASLAVEDDQDVLAHVATEAGEAALRRAALERIARPGLLVERCQRDPDADIRLWLLSRIDAPATLARIAEAARKGDKLLARAARERLEALKLAAGDPETLRARCMAICDTVNALRRERPADYEARRAALAQEWSTLRSRVDEGLVATRRWLLRDLRPGRGTSGADRDPGRGSCG